MSRAELTGKKFGRLLVLSFFKMNGQGRSTWNCVCDCGKKTIGIGRNMTSGVSKSCGCLMKEMSRNAALIHGKRYTTEYEVWSHMKDRCLNKKARAYPFYGGRGISIHPEWAASFMAFLRDMGKRPPGRSIDRINNDGNYEPGNCRWATVAEQNRNRSISLKRNVTKEAAKLGITYGAAYQRIKRGKL